MSVKYEIYDYIPKPLHYEESDKKSQCLRNVDHILVSNFVS